MSIPICYTVPNLFSTIFTLLIPLRHLRAFVRHQLLQRVHIHLAAAGKHGGIHMPQPVQRAEALRQLGSLFDLRPGFFQHLLTTTNWQNFEEYTYYLLKLLGIQTVYHFLGERQAGRADGFFKQGNLAVLYDCTLRTEQIEYTKNDQLANYCHQLQHGSLDITQETQENFPHHHKQVWIISRGTTRRIKLINGLEIKEIAIADLMCLYDERLRQKLPEHILESVLRNLGTE